MIPEQKMNQLPTLENFTEYMKSLNITRTDEIVCYDQFGIYSSPRLAYTLKYFGMQNVRVLDGGLKKWLMESRYVETGLRTEE